MELLQDIDLSTLQVRYIGVSNETSWGVCQFHAAAKAHGLPKVQTIQNSYSLVYRGAFETDLAETCATHNANVSLLVRLLRFTFTGRASLNPAHTARLPAMLSIFADCIAARRHTLPWQAAH